jgi:hypothetical protein
VGEVIVVHDRLTNIAFWEIMLLCMIWIPLILDGLMDLKLIIINYQYEPYSRKAWRICTLIVNFCNCPLQQEALFTKIK